MPVSHTPNHVSLRTLSNVELGVLSSTWPGVWDTDTACKQCSVVSPGGGGMDKQALQQLQSIQQLLKNPPPVQVETKIMSSSTYGHYVVFHIFLLLFSTAGLLSSSTFLLLLFKLSLLNLTSTFHIHIHIHLFLQFNKKLLDFDYSDEEEDGSREEAVPQSSLDAVQVSSRECRLFSEALDGCCFCQEHLGI